MVKLVSCSSSHIEGITSAEDLVVYCARVSNPTNQLNLETAPRLLAFLIKHKHWSPFEMVSMAVEIKTSRAIAAQILRHRSFSFQEFSQRYAQATLITPIEWRMQGKTNRQVGDESVALTPQLTEQVESLIAQSKSLYDSLINNGIAKECARMVLPQCTETTLYMSGTIRSWIHYLEIRTDVNTQLEHRTIAEQIKQIFVQQFPCISESLQWR